MSPGVPALRTTVERSGRSVLVRAHGELDLATAAALRRALDEAVAGARVGTGDGAVSGAGDTGPVDLVVDLAGLAFVDATGLGALLHAADAVEAAGGRLRLASPSRMLRRMLQLLELEQRLPVAGSWTSSQNSS